MNDSVTVHPATQPSLFIPHGSHDYVFQLFALDRPLGLMPGATRGDLVEAMDGHVIGAAVLTATYARSDEDDWDDDDGG